MLSRAPRTSTITTTQKEGSLDFSLTLNNRVTVKAIDVEKLWTAIKSGAFSSPGAFGPPCDLLLMGPPMMGAHGDSKRVAIGFLMNEELALPIGKLDSADLQRKIKKHLGHSFFLNGASIYWGNSKEPANCDRVIKFPTEPSSSSTKLAKQLGSQLAELLKDGHKGPNGPTVLVEEEDQSETDQRFALVSQDIRVTSAEELSRVLQLLGRSFLVYLDGVAKASKKELPLERIVFEAPEIIPEKRNKNGGPRLVVGMPKNPADPGANGDQAVLSDMLFAGLKGKLREAGLITQPEPILFEHIAGQGKAVELLKNYALQLKLKPEFERYGALIPRGILMTGPAGNGKTTLAKALAYTAGTPFILVSPEQAIDGIVGGTQRRIMTFFEIAAEEAEKSNLKHAILFFDEIDTLIGDRSNLTHSHDRGLIGVLSQAMQGFKWSKNITVVAASNRPIDMDNAIRSRFPITIGIENPDQAGRAQILQARLEYREANTKNRLCGDIDWGQVAKKTEGYSGRDLEDLINSVCTLVAKRAIEQKSEGIELIQTQDVLAALARFKKTSDGHRNTIGWHSAAND